MFPTSFMKTQEQHPSYVQEPLEAWPSSFLDPQERSKLLSPAACLFHLCSSVILQFSLSWWKTLCIFGLNNPNHLDMQQTEEMRAEKSGTPHTKVCALPQHHRNLVPFREKCHLWACLRNPNTLQENPGLAGTSCLQSAQFFSSHCSGHKVFLIFADKSVAFKRLLCASPAAELCGRQLFNCSVTQDNTQTSLTALKLVQWTGIIKST